jgi:hypothetical protein
MALFFNATCLALAVVVFLLALDRRYMPKQASNEPPVVKSLIPYIGHIVGLIRHGTRYYQNLRYGSSTCILYNILIVMASSQCKLPIYTLNMMNSKVYVVAGPELINAVNRNSKALAFNPFIAQLGKRITGHDEATGHIVNHNLNGEDGSGYVIELHDKTVASLAPGKDLENMTGVMLQEALVYLQGLEVDPVVDLYTWTKSLMTICSTRAIYGPENPFSKDASLVDDFWYVIVVRRDGACSSVGSGNSIVI